MLFFPLGSTIKNSNWEKSNNRLGKPKNKSFLKGSAIKGEGGGGKGLVVKEKITFL